MADTASSEYTLRIEPTEDHGEEDGMKFRAVLTPMSGDPYPQCGYGETAVEAAVEVVAAFVQDPPTEGVSNAN